MDNSIAERLCLAAEINLGLPYSLMCDAWDLLAQEWPQEAFTREQFEGALAHRIDAWDADQTGYQFNARALDWGASDYDPADDEPDVWGADAIVKLDPADYFPPRG